MARSNPGSSPEYVVICVDGPNADNQAAVWGALNAFDNERLQLAAVVVSATAVDYRPNAPIGSRHNGTSEDVHFMHTARMAGLLARAGSRVPVYMGQFAAQTAITTPIPHDAHVNHDDYDLYGDNTGVGYRAIKGDFRDALDHLDGLDNKLHVVVGGPFTEVPFMMKRPGIANKLGSMAAQAGFELSKRAIYSKLAFNVEVDEAAALETLLDYPGPMYNVPSDITRAPAATFRSAEALVRFGVHPEIGDIFIRHRARAEERHKAEQLRRELAGRPFRPYPALSVHDLQAVMALRQGLGYERGVFEFGRIDPEQAVTNMLRVGEMQAAEGRQAVITPEVVASLGYLGGSQTTRGTIADRFVVTAQDTQLYKRRARRLLASR